MNELLGQVLDVHGGLERWQRYQRVDISIAIGGGFFALKGLQQDAISHRMTVWLHEERTLVAPFEEPDQRMVFNRDRVVVEKLDGTVVTERRAPRDSFAGHQMNTPWDSIQRAYYNGEASWTYLTTPFLLAADGVAVEEIEPWTEGPETWRVLRAFFPGSIETHSLIQEFYFGPDFLMRRHDYNVNIAGGFSASQLTSSYINSNGIRLPATRRAYTRGPDRRPIREMLMLSIDISDVLFT